MGFVAVADEAEGVVSLMSLPGFVFSAKPRTRDPAPADWGAVHQACHAPALDEGLYGASTEARAAPQRWS